MKKIATALALAAGLVVAGVAPAQAATPVVPNAPVITPAYGSCQNGTFVVDEADVLLPAVENGRWLVEDENGQAIVTPSHTFTDVAPGEYTYQFITAEGDFEIPASPGGADDYYLSNGVASYTVSLAAVPVQTCLKTPFVKNQPTAYCSGGRLYFTTGWISLPSNVGHRWFYNNKAQSSQFAVPGTITAPTTYNFVAKTDAGVTVGTYPITVNPPVRPAC